MKIYHLQIIIETNFVVKNCKDFIIKKKIIKTVHKKHREKKKKKKRDRENDHWKKEAL